LKDSAVDDGTDFEELNYYLYHFCSFLTHSKRLRKVVVNVDASRFADADVLADEVSWPLAKLPALESFAINGVSEVVKNRLLAEMRHGKPSDNFKRAMDLLPRMNDFVSALRRDGGLADLVESVSRTREVLVGFLQDSGCMDHKRDSELVRALSRCEAALSKLKQAVQEKVPSFNVLLAKLP
jgi:hypothetical protein